MAGNPTQGGDLRLRDELGLEPDPAEDVRAATKITAWLEAAAA